MKIESCGREKNKGFIIPAIQCKIEEIDFEKVESGFKILYLKKGEKKVKLNSIELNSQVPVLIMMGKDDIIEIIKIADSEAVIFKPILINSEFTFENINTIPDISNGSIRMEYFYLKPFIERRGNYNGIIELGISEDFRTAEFIARIYKELKLQPDKFWPCRGRMSIIEMLYFIENMPSAKRDEHINNISLENKLLKEITTYICKNYEKEISVSLICKEIGINRTKLQDIMKAGVKQTFNEYLLKIRVEMACKMLSDTMLPIIEVMYGTGFSNSSNFNRVFKREVNLTPKEYRKQFSKFSL